MRIAQVRPAALKDLAEAARWYESQQEGLGREFLDEAWRAVAKIEEHPGAYAIVRKTVRRVMTERFPYGVYYIIKNEQVVVIGVFHCRRSPKVWWNRWKSSR